MSWLRYVHVHRHMSRTKKLTFEIQGKDNLGTDAVDGAATVGAAPAPATAVAATASAFRARCTHQMQLQKKQQQQLFVKR